MAGHLCHLAVLLTALGGLGRGIVSAVFISWTSWTELLFYLDFLEGSPSRSWTTRTWRLKQHETTQPSPVLTMS